MFINLYNITSVLFLENNFFFKYSTEIHMVKSELYPWWLIFRLHMVIDSSRPLSTWFRFSWISTCLSFRIRRKIYKLVLVLIGSCVISESNPRSGEWANLTGQTCVIWFIPRKAVDSLLQEAHRFQVGNWNYRIFCYGYRGSRHWVEKTLNFCYEDIIIVAKIVHKNHSSIIIVGH